MKSFLFIFLAGYAVNCDDKYYVVSMPDITRGKEFKVYWNVPTTQCKSKGYDFEDLFEKYGIIQNTNDSFRGDAVTILYDPGNFPALIKDGAFGGFRYRNGGVPQEGDLMDHLQHFKKDIESSIPDKGFSGLGIIDFESWRPILRQNFGSLTPYKDVSYDIERKRHWWWKKKWIEDQANHRFDESGREFMKSTLSLAKQLRPKAVWGYYGYAQCFNRPQNSQPEECANKIQEENDRIAWLWRESTALYPSVYSTADVTGNRLSAFIRGRIKESDRVRLKGTPIYPYWWLRYRDGEFFKQNDLDTSFKTFYNSKVSGFIIWGSSKDVNTKEKCLELKTYVTKILGPTVAKYTESTRKYNDLVQHDDISFKPELVTEFDPEYNWEPPENYTANIEQIVEEELKNEKEIPEIDGSILIDMILNKMLNNEEGSTTVLATKNPFEDSISRSTARISTEKPTINQESNPTSETSVMNKIATTEEIASGELSTVNNIESNEFSIINIGTSIDPYITSQNSFENNTEFPLETIQNTVESDILNFEETNTTNYNKGVSHFEETIKSNLDNDTKTTHNVQENSSTVSNFINLIDKPKLNLNKNSITLNYNSTESNLDLINTSTSDVSDASPLNLESVNILTSSTTLRPDVINWKEFYLNLLNFSSGRKEIDSSASTGTTVATDLEQVLVPISAASPAIAISLPTILLISLILL